MSSGVIGVNSHAVEESLDRMNTIHEMTAGMGKTDVAIDGYLIKTGQADGHTYTPVTPVGNENPKEEGWYEKVDNNYILTEDTEVDALKTYYERS